MTEESGTVAAAGTMVKDTPSRLAGQWTEEGGGSLVKRIMALRVGVKVRVEVGVRGRAKMGARGRVESGRRCLDTPAVTLHSTS